MPTYPIPPGAWLSGGSSASFKPVSPPGSGHKPVSPPKGLSAGDDADFKPTTPPSSAHRPLPTTPAPLPWEGADPSWVYESGAGLLGQALRKSRAKVLRVADDQLTPAEIAAARATGRAVRIDKLWRWDPQFRIETLQCELAGRCMVRGATLWLIDPGAGDDDAPPKPKAHPLFKIGPVNDLPDEQVDKVLRAAVEREDRLPEILSQADDFWPFFESVISVRLGSAPRLAELLAVAQDWGMRLLMGLKHGVAAKRPMQWSSLVIPVIPTPGHGSLPSGHATVAALNAELLRILLYGGDDALSGVRAKVLDRLARRIAFNRVVAGVHFPVDSLVGYALGTQLARVLHALAGVNGAALPSLVNETRMAELDPGPVATATGLLDKPDRELRELGDTRLPDPPSGVTATPASGWAELWRRAVQELDELRV